jgi:LysM repeat protein
MLLLLSSFLLLVAVRTQAQDSQPNITGYSCSNSSSLCDTYAFYRAQAPDFLDLLNISDLFGVQRAQIASASNLPSTTISVVDGQSLLVPIRCGCMGNYSQANITYTIFKDDTYYAVSTRKFENLTTYQAVEVANPTLVPTDLTIGVLVTFPIRCKCPSQAQVSNGTKMLITYLVHPEDTLSSISQKFGADLQNLKSLNGMNSTLTPYATVLVPVSQNPVLAQPPSSSPSPPPPPPSATIGNNSTSGGGSNTGVVIGASLGGAAALGCIALFVFCVLRWRDRSHKQTSISEGPKPPSDARIRSFGRENIKKNLISDISDCIEKPFLYSVEDLQKATQNFSPLSNIDGSVYKGTIDGKDYAIKLMKGDISQELRLLQKVNHTNLVKLEGFCISSEGQSYLIYDYVENGSLNTWLHDPESVQDMTASDWSSSSLSWKTRLQIALDVANGLHYIHKHTTPSVVHKDIKSSNILLDGKFRAKIANFGMAKSGINALTKHIMGTQGYMAPEYLADGFVSPMLDVFAFGVVLLELISGKEALVRQGGVPIAGKAGLLWTQINPLLEGEDREEELRKWADGNQQMEYSIDAVLGLAIIARACVEEDPGARPTLPEIVYKLSNLLEACASIPDENFEVSTSVIGR